MPNWKPATDEEIDAQSVSARDAYRQKVEAGLVAVAACYNQGLDRVVVELLNGTSILFPPAIAQGLAGASAEDLMAVEVMPGGRAINWDRLETGFTVDGLLAGIFGGKEWMRQLMIENARKGGRSRSRAKGAASRENGKRGGRPKKAAV